MGEELEQAAEDQGKPDIEALPELRGFVSDSHIPEMQTEGNQIMEIGARDGGEPGDYCKSRSESENQQHEEAERFPESLHV
jgi:hypothetical protein